MKRTYELPSKLYENTLFFEIEWDEENHTITTYEGNIWDYHSLEHQTQKQQKKHQNKEEAQKVFEEYCQKCEAKGCILPDYEFLSWNWSSDNYRENFFIEQAFRPNVQTIQEQLDEVMKQTHLRGLHLTDPMKKLSLPETLCGFQDLEYLHLTRFDNLPENIGQLKKLRVLIINDSSITKLPRSIVECESLEYLTVTLKALYNLPKDIGKLKNLKFLNCSYTYIKELPESIAECSNLHTIQAKECKNLQKLPSNLGKLKKLKTLSLGSCNFKEFPIEVTQLENLTELHLIGCKIAKIPSAIQNMQALKVLNLTGNKDLKEFPDTFLELENLSHLSMPGNEQKDIPKILLDMKNLHYIDLTSNHWHPTKIDLSTHRKELIEYFHIDIENNYFQQQKLLESQQKKQFKEDIANLDKNPFIRTQPNQLEQIFLEKFKEDPQTFLAQCERQTDDEKAISVIVHFMPEAFEPYAEDWFFGGDIITSRKTDFNINNLLAFCRFNPEKYESFLLRVAQFILKVDTNVNIHIALHLLYGDKYQKAIVEVMNRFFLYYLREWRSYYWNFFVPNVKENTTFEMFKWIIENFKEEVKEMLFKVAHKQNITKSSEMFFECILKNYEAETIELLMTFLQINNNPPMAFELLEGYDYSQYSDKIWNFLANGYRSLAIQKLKELYTPEELFKRGQKLLESDQLMERGGAIELLISLDNPKVKNLLKKAFKVETAHINLMILTSYFLKLGEKKLVKDILKKSLTEDPKYLHRIQLIEHLANLNEQDFIRQQTLNAFEKVKDDKKLKKPPKKWLDETQLPDLYWKDGKKVDPLFMRFLFQEQNKKSTETYKILQENALILEDFDREKGADFADTLLSLILNKEGIKATTKGLTPIAATLGDERVAEALQKYAIDRKSELAAALLSNMYSSKGARAANNIMLHFHSKYPNVKEAAYNSLESIAQNLGITRMELLDSIIPDFGFIDLFKSIEMEDKKYRAFITTDFKLAYLDELDKIKKTLPSKAPKELKAEIKKLNKDIKTMAKEQKISLEHYMLNTRFWNKKDWEAHFMKKPLMFAFAQGLIWGIYKKEELIETFAVNQDQTLENADFDEITLPKDAEIRIVHPVELDEEKRQTWQEYLDSNKIEQAFEQMHRPAFSPQDMEQYRRITEQMKGAEIPDYPFRSAMRKFGWRIGKVETGSVFDYYKEYEDGTMATLDMKEAHVQSDMLDYAIVKQFAFNDALEHISPIIYSETMYDLDRLLQKAKDV